MSVSQRAKYFKWDGNKIRCSGATFPKKFFNTQSKDIVIEPIIENLKDIYFLGLLNKGKIGQVTRSSNVSKLWLQHKSNVILCEQIEDNLFTPIVANTTKVGTPKMYLINGQDIYNGHLQNHMLGFVMNKIKECYYPYIKDLKPIDFYPVKIKCEVHDTIKNNYVKAKSETGQRWDVDNLVYPYLKAFPDLLTRKGILKDDDRLHLPSSIHAEFFPIDNHEDRKLVFTIEKDEREVLKQNRLFYNFHNVKKNEETFETEDLELVKEEPFDFIPLGQGIEKEIKGVEEIKFLKKDGTI